MKGSSYGAALNSLGKLLDKLQQHPDVISSTELSEILTNAIDFHQIVQNGFSEILEEVRELRHTTAQLSGTYKETPPTFEEVLPFYQAIYEAGGSARLVCDVAIANDVTKTMLVRILRSLYGLSLEDAHRFINNE
jgi:hypothetical protein